MAELGEKAWYAVNTFPGQENRVADALLRRVESLNLQEIVFRVLVAEHEVEKEKTKKGEKIIYLETENLYPGYVFIEMIMTDDAWYIVRNTQGVTGFVGSSGKGTKPFPIPSVEIEPVLKRMGVVENDMYERYHVGDVIKITAGLFENTTGKILAIDKENAKIRVEVIFYGKPKIFDIEFSDIERI